MLVMQLCGLEVSEYRSVMYSKKFKGFVALISTGSVDL